MSKDIDTIQFRNSDGEYVYAKAHLDSIDGMEDYTDGLIQVTQLLGDYIFDSGWQPYEVHKNATPNALYTSDGFKCGIREIVLNQNAFGNGVKPRLKMIRVNIRNFAHNEQLAQLPQGFMTTTQVFWARGGNGYLPIMVEVRGDGKVTPRIMVEDVNKPNNSNWIYAQFTWIE
ncbi:hypothetical protein [Staphylococcus shinii]|uniref:hypothetical protein n=1 Tax=Staphylococcus shinii TaxID=2912228 RepID=UPI003F564C88